jgi:transcriptional regulator with XRE-family HTH domain
MNLSETRDSQADDYEEAGPLAVRMLLGARLRKLREAAGVSREDAGNAIRGSESKISRLELGRTGSKQRDISDLLDLYEVSEDERATLLAMMASANAPAWWQQHGGAVPDWLTDYLGLEQAAEVIRCYEVQFVPGLLQTREYARALFEADGDPGLDTGPQVSVRMRRQQVLHRARPPRLWAVIDEAVLRRPIGGAAVMRAQLEHLIEMAQLSHVRIQVALFSAGSRAVASGPITLLRFPEAVLDDVVYLEQHASASYLNKPAEAQRYRGILNRLVTEASPSADTEAILCRILRET